MLERLHISRHESSIDEWGYNIREGGSQGKLSQQTKDKISKTMTGRKLSKSHIQNMSNVRKGKKYSIERKKNISNNRKGIKPNINTQKRKKMNKKISKGQWGIYPGVKYQKNINPEYKCWNARINFNGHNNSLGWFFDPISASIVYLFVWREIYD